MIPRFNELIDKWETTWDKPVCCKCPHWHYEENKGGRCYAIYPYIGIPSEYEDKHHYNCPISNYFDCKEIGVKASKYGGIREIAKITVLRKYIKRKSEALTKKDDTK